MQYIITKNYQIFVKLNTTAKLGWKCLILEKKKFPRDKYCGDAVCKTAIEILMDMGVYDQLIRENKAHMVNKNNVQDLYRKKLP